MVFVDSDGNLRQLAINVRTERPNIGEKVLDVTIGISMERYLPIRHVRGTKLS